LGNSASGKDRKGSLEQKSVLNKSPVADRLARLRKGINLSNWFAQGKSGDLEHVKHFINTTDIQEIKKLGFTHVRLPIDPSYFLDENNPSRLNPEYLAELDRAIALITSQDLAVIIDLHHPGDGFRKRLAHDDRFVTAVETLWRSLAGHYSAYSPNLMFFEVLNEPAFTYMFDDRQIGIKRWVNVQERLIKAIRQSTPQHTLIVSDPDFGNIEHLLQMPLLSDKNVIYNIHFYEPMVFTNQGADWIKNFQSLKDIPYPFSQGACQSILPKLKADIRGAIEWYCKVGWGRSQLEAEIAKLAAWQKEHNAKLLVTEFGVYKLAPTRDRLNWLMDTRSLFEKYDIGWTMWEYAGGFGLTEADSRSRSIDPEVIKALGMNERS
jgi:aryl-phospho-beta-D-glucosidase BglC (GH1 family)